MTPNQLGLTKDEIRSLWRTTPAALAATLSKHDPTPWIPARHLQLLSRWIVDAVTGRRPRIIINMPPRHGKSELISKWTPVWFLENWPHLNVMNVGFATEFAEKWGREVRNLVTKHQGRLSFDLAGDSKARGRWNTNQGGGMIATGVGGQITGRGAHLMVIDDPIKDHRDANSSTVRDFLWDWWSNTAITRLEPNGAVIVLMTRWHEDDLVGRLLNQMKDGGQNWEVLNLPAIAGRTACNEHGIPLLPESWEMDTNYGPCPLGRAPGEALWPWRYDRESLDLKRRGLSAEAWAAQYQGTPANMVGAGNVYNAFSMAGNVGPTLFNPYRPICWSMDFNVDPMCSVLGQWDDEVTARTLLTNEFNRTVQVHQEMCLPNSNTQEMCEAFLQRTAAYVQKLQGQRLSVRIYGDRSGNSRKTVGDTDYRVVKNYFAGRHEYHVTTHLSNANPAVRDRVNAVNERLGNAAGERNTRISPGCIELIKDLREVRWKRDAAGNTTGNIDKSDMKRTHVSDAYGYWIEKEFSLARSNQSHNQPGCFR